MYRHSHTPIPWKEELQDPGQRQLSLGIIEFKLRRDGMLVLHLSRAACD